MTDQQKEYLKLWEEALIFKKQYYAMAQKASKIWDTLTYEQMVEVICIADEIETKINNEQ